MPARRSSIERHPVFQVFALVVTQAELEVAGLAIFGDVDADLDDGLVKAGQIYGLADGKFEMLRAAAVPMEAHDGFPVRHRVMGAVLPFFLPVLHNDFEIQRITEVADKLGVTGSQATDGGEKNGEGSHVVLEEMPKTLAGELLPVACFFYLR